MPIVSNSTDRRDFLKGLLGLNRTREPVSRSGSFYWADLKTGQIGFPTGTGVAVGNPGSIMKLIAAAVIHENGLLTDATKLECRGAVNIGRQTYACQVAHGRLSLVEALGRSCNVYFAQAAEHINPKIFLEFARLFKLDCPVAGVAPPAWTLGDMVSNQQYVLGLAEGWQLNALQILQLVALVATRGSLPILHSAEKPEGGSCSLTRELSSGTWTVLQQGMRLACREGTARKLDPDDRLLLAAKTGTAPHGKTFQSWVAGYFPWNDPRHAFCLRASVGTSQDEAVPLARVHLFATEWP